MITREQVADLRPGDVVRVIGWRGVTIEGALEPSANGSLWLAGHLRLRYGADGLSSWADATDATLTVVSRAPRPLYVNHDRPEPVPGDVVRDADSDDSRTWTRNAKGFAYEWLNSVSHNYEPREKLPPRLRLLVDGETGQAVQ